MNNENSILNDATLDEASGGFNFGSLFGIPAAQAPSPKSFFNFATNSVVSHSPVLSFAHKLKFW